MYWQEHFLCKTCSLPIGSRDSLHATMTCAISVIRPKRILNLAKQSLVCPWSIWQSPHRFQLLPKARQWYWRHLKKISKRLHNWNWYYGASFIGQSFSVDSMCPQGLGQAVVTWRLPRTRYSGIPMTSRTSPVCKHGFPSISIDKRRQ